jgi:hypothetical protein
LNRGNTTQALEIADRLRATSLFAPTTGEDTVAVIQRRLAVDEAVHLLFSYSRSERTRGSSEEMAFILT